MAASSGVSGPLLLSEESGGLIGFLEYNTLLCDATTVAEMV